MFSRVVSVHAQGTREAHLEVDPVYSPANFKNSMAILGYFAGSNPTLLRGSGHLVTGYM